MLSRSLLRGARLVRGSRVTAVRPSVARLSSVPSRPARQTIPQIRKYSSKSAADEKIEEIQDQYALAKDEFDIAHEETEKMTVYAQDDRTAAREELTKLEELYKEALENAEPGVAEEIQNRVGQRIRELSNAVKNMEELAQNQD